MQKGAIGCNWVQLTKMLRMMRFVEIPENLKKVQLGAKGCNWVQLGAIDKNAQDDEIRRNT